MFFGKEKIKCEKCKSSFKEDYSYCPYCGNPVLDVEKSKMEYGMLGKNDVLDEESVNDMASANVSFLDKLMESAMNSMVKAMEKEMKGSMNDMGKPEIKAIPNGISIRLGMPVQSQPKRKQEKRTISPEQIQRMSKMPKATAKSHVRRLSDKVVYELLIPGINNPEDVFITKLEKGYEIRAIGKSKVYVNSLPIELPIKGFSFDKTKLQLEFKDK